MNIDGDEADENEDHQAPFNGHSVTDATHPRLKRRMVRCKQASHGAFPYSSLKKHFKHEKHESVGSACVYCGNSTIYEYFEVSNPKQIKLHHDCGSLDHDRPLDQGNETSLQRTEQDEVSVSPRSTPTNIESESQLNEPHSDAESSGIGTACSSMLSVFNGASYNNRRMSDSPSKISCKSVGEVSREEGSPNKSSNNE